MKLLDGRSYCPPLQQLAEELEVCQRSVRRYLDAMSLAGLQVPPLLSEYRESEVSMVTGGGR